MDVGVVTRSFPQLSTSEAAALIADNGFRWVELCLLHTDADYWRYNSRSDLSSLTNKKMTKIVNTFKNKGLEVPVLGVFTNLISPDDDELKANLEYYERHMQYAADNGIPALATECGFIPDNRGISVPEYESRFNRLVDSFKWLCEKAEKYDVYITLEPSVIDIVPSAKRCKDFLDMVDSKRANVLIDPANLIPNSSEEDMFKYLKDDVFYFHGKDRKVTDAKGRVVGDGDIDWILFLSLYHKYSEGKPFILEYVNIDNFVEIKNRVIEYDKAIKS